MFFSQIAGIGDLHHVELLKLVVVLHYADPAYALVTESEPQQHRQRHKNAYLEDLNEDKQVWIIERYSMPFRYAFSQLWDEFVSFKRIVIAYPQLNFVLQRGRVNPEY